jgi:hypothetical protein
MSLTESQKAFATSRSAFPAFVGGFGSGKSAAAIARAMALKAHFRDCDIAYYLPTYPLVEDIAFRRFPELCDRKGWAYKLNRTSAFIEFPNAGRIVFRTMERPERIIGYEVAHSVLDELDTLPTEKAREVWNKVIARNRQKCSMGNTVAVATTPEGFRFVWERWVKNKAPGYELFRAKTMDNAANLPDGYIDNLRNSYPTALLSAYLDGEFTNLTAGSVYPEFDRALNATNETVKPGDALHVSLDFNVGHMAAVVFVLRDGNPYAVDEIIDAFDTPEMCRIITDRFKSKGHSILVYPDASGSGRRSNDASQSDIAILKQSGFQVCANPANPAIKDRVLSMNRMIHNEGTRLLKVNPDKCPHLVESLEKQAYNKAGEPDKSGGLDHVLDSAGYFISYKFPIVRRAAIVSTLRF